MPVLPRSFYKNDTVQVARDLIGKIIVQKTGKTVFKGIIAETEAYRSDDPASHAFKRKTERNSALFGPVGHTYVYLSYGLHYCLNIVSRDVKNFPAGGVLIRALIPIMVNSKPVLPALVSGPGRVGKLLAINLSYNDIDVTKRSSLISIATGVDIDQSFIQTTERIGISVAKEFPWRFVISKSYLKNKC